jgi:hypothetical protein
LFYGQQGQGQQRRLVIMGGNISCDLQDPQTFGTTDPKISLK